jgi:hypothetical protein
VFVSETWSDQSGLEAGDGVVGSQEVETGQGGGVWRGWVVAQHRDGVEGAVPSRDQAADGLHVHQFERDRQLVALRYRFDVCAQLVADARVCGRDETTRARCEVAFEQKRASAGWPGAHCRGSVS